MEQVYGRANRQAAVFMHELGHNLGLIYDPNNDGDEDADPAGTITVMNYYHLALAYQEYSSTEWNSVNLHMGDIASLPYTEF
jgi:hypothetical protein